MIYIYIYEIYLSFTSHRDSQYATATRKAIHFSCDARCEDAAYDLFEADPVVVRSSEAAKTSFPVADDRIFAL